MMTTKEKDEGKKSLSEKKGKLTKIQWITITVLALGNLFVGGSISLLAPFFPQEAERKGVKPSEYGFIFGMYYTAMFIAAPFVGKLISYVQPKFMLNAGILTCGVTCLVFGFFVYIPDRITFIALSSTMRFLDGVGSAILRTAIYALVAAQFPGNMGKVYVTLESALSVGYIVGSTAGGALYDLGGFGLPFYIIGSLILVDAVLFFIVIPKSVRSKNDEKGQFCKFWFDSGTFVYASTIFTAFTYSTFTMSTLEPHIRELNLSKFYIGLIFTAVGVSYALTSFVCGWLCDRKVNVHLIMAVGFISIIGSQLLIGPMPFLKIKSGIGNIIPALLLLGLGIGAKAVPTFTGSLQNSQARGFPDDINTHALTSSMIASAQSLGGIIGPALGGYLLETKGYNVCIYAVLAMEVATLVCLVLYTSCSPMCQRVSKCEIVDLSPVDVPTNVARY